MTRAREYLDDRLIAINMAEKEEKMQLLRQQLQELTIQADQAFAMYLSAEGQVPSDQLARLKKTHEELQTKADALKETIKNADIAVGRGVDLILTGLGISKTEVKAGESKVDPLVIFSPDEMKRINEHYQRIPENLQNLMDAALNDSVTLQLITNPVFVRKDGHVYNLDTLNKLLEATGSAACPLNPGIRFVKADIVPCNSIINAMTLLLNVIDDERKVTPAKSAKLERLTSTPTRKRVSAEQIGLIEKIYMRMLPKHQALFDAICRDPETGFIMDDPVLLPDGYAYDSSTAMTYLMIRGGQCPRNPSIQFSKADLTPCHFVISVLDKLKEVAMPAVRATAAVAEAARPLSVGLALRR